MSDYTQMSAHYDAIMTSGYYDYAAIVNAIVSAAPDQPDGAVLEIGAGTGLILEQLARQRPGQHLVGIDFTQAMLDIAAQRLAGLPQIALHQQDVTAMCLDQTFSLAFSYGGVWYFSQDGDELTMISHLRDDGMNQQGLERIAAHLPAGGTLLLGIQGPHTDYARPISNGMEYAQQITPLTGGFRKRYTLADAGTLVMEQVTDYRVYSLGDAVDLLDKCGFDPISTPATSATSATTSGGLFMGFSKR
jgi:SAM-dependent methyltransferase